jgi:hypothetical protein
MRRNSGLANIILNRFFLLMNNIVSDRRWSQDYWLCIVYEADLNVCLTMCISLSGKDHHFCIYYYFFFKQLRNRYGRRKPIFTDGAQNGTTMLVLMVVEVLKHI